MKQYSDAAAKALQEAEIISRKQKESMGNNLLAEMYYFALERSGKNESAAEMEAEMKLDEAVGTGRPANEILNLALDWYSEGKEAGFKMGFHMATKLLMEGMAGGAS